VDHTQISDSNLNSYGLKPALPTMISTSVLISVGVVPHGSMMFSYGPTERIYGGVITGVTVIPSTFHKISPKVTIPW
jgi:hypothetical protein